MANKWMLLAYIVLVELIGLGVLFANLLILAYSHGGVITLDMTQYGEQHAEYWLMLALVATAPWALWQAQRYLEGDNT